MTQVSINPDDDGWRGPWRPQMSPYDALLNEFRDIKRQLAALQRAAPGRASGMRMAADGVTFEDKMTASGATTIAGVGMNTFIPQQQAIRTEVVAARGTWPDIGTRIGEVSSKADATQSEVTTARGAHATLGVRMLAISSKADDTQSEVTAARGGSPNLDARLDAMPSASSVSTLQSQMSTVRDALVIIIDMVEDLGARLNDLDGKGMGTGTWPPPLPSIPP